MQIILNKRDPLNGSRTEAARKRDPGVGASP
jgi:hypothetical protein